MEELRYQVVNTAGSIAAHCQLFFIFSILTTILEDLIFICLFVVSLQ